MPYYPRGIVNTSFVAGVCLLADFIFCTALTLLLIVVVELGLLMQIQHTQLSIIELFYLTCQIVLFDVHSLTPKDPSGVPYIITAGIPTH
jgi:hypothetical protein